MTGQQGAENGHPIATRVTAMLDRPVATLTAIQAVQHIRACVAFSRALFSAIEAQIMEAAWVVRRDYPDRADFESFVEGQGLGDAMSPAQAWRHAETWDVIRRQRPLRDLAQDRAGEAMRLVCEYRDAGGDGGALDDDDRRILDALSQPRSKRGALLREMARSQREAHDGRHPDDVARIRELEAERVAGQGVEPPSTHPGVFLSELADAERTLADLAERLAQWADAPGSAVGLGAARCNRAMLACDMAIGSLERISEIVQVLAAVPPDGAA